MGSGRPACPKSARTVGQFSKLAIRRALRLRRSRRRYRFADLGQVGLHAYSGSVQRLVWVTSIRTRVSFLPVAPGRVAPLSI